MTFVGRKYVGQDPNATSKLRKDSGKLGSVGDSIKDAPKLGPKLRPRLPVPTSIKDAPKLGSTENSNVDHKRPEGPKQFGSRHELLMEFLANKDEAPRSKKPVQSFHDAFALLGQFDQNHDGLGFMTRG